LNVANVFFKYFKENSYVIKAIFSPQKKGDASGEEVSTTKIMDMYGNFETLRNEIVKDKITLKTFSSENFNMA